MELDISILEEIGQFTNQLKKDVMKIPKVNLNILEIIEYIENKIFEAGYLPAFPCTVCINEQAAHFTVFDEEIKLKDGDIVKIDFGVSHKGFITDTAFTVEINNNKYKNLLQANKEALEKALEIAKPGIKISEIGKAVNEIAQINNFNTIHNLSGHQITINDLHAGIQVPNYDNNSDEKIEIGMELAIEPFFTTGDPLIKEGPLGNILHLKNEKPIRDPIAKKVLIHIKENFSHLPFSKRWLLKKFNKRQILYALKLLKRENIVYEYATLVSIDNSIISQFEDTIVFVDNNIKKIITRL